MDTERVDLEDWRNKVVPSSLIQEKDGKLSIDVEKFKQSLIKNLQYKCDKN